MNTTATKGITIEMIEAMTETDAKHASVPNGGEIIPDVNDHTLYLADLGGYFGYSCLVFCEGRHIYYANDYELHHQYAPMSRDQLRDHYIRRAFDILYTDEQLKTPLKDYQDYKRRLTYIMSYYAQRKTFIGSKYIVGDKEKYQDNALFDSVNWRYTREASREWIDRHEAMMDKLQRQLKEDTVHNQDFWVGAFEYEMWNHEYGYNWDGDWDVMSAFDYCCYNERIPFSEFFNKLDITTEQRNAYYIARSNYFAKANL